MPTTIRHHLDGDPLIDLRRPDEFDAILFLTNKNDPRFAKQTENFVVLQFNEQNNPQIAVPLRASEARQLAKSLINLADEAENEDCKN